MRMPSELSDETLDFLLARAGLTLSEAQKADLKSVYPGIAEMAARVRQRRGIMAELAHTYGFAEEDL
jgi:orotate phosphoribosyltransferase-like protein